MIIRTFFLIAMCLSSARALDISGTILETGTNKPIAGAQVCLAPDLLACVNAQTNGTFRITDSAAVSAASFGRTIRAGRIAVQRGRLSVDLSLVKKCRLEVFGLDGRLIERTGEPAGGTALWPASRTRSPRDGVYIVRLTGDFGQAICKVETIGGMVVSANGASHIGSFAYNGAAKRAAGTQDTLVVGCNGYAALAYVPTNATETGVTIHLTPFVVAPLSDSVGFVRNDELKKSAKLDTNAFSLSVTDKSGLTWTLIVPASPFSIKTAISMIPISPAGSSTIQGGVLFEPDGYYFAEPAKLIVTGATTPLAITTFNHNGSNSGLAAYQKTAGPDTIDIFHFSGAGGQDAGTYNNQGECTADEAQMKVVKAERDALLATPVFVPDPPSIRNECYYELDAASQARINALICQYDDLFQLPEVQIIRNILAITRRECFFQCATCDETFSYVAPLAARLQKKINLAMKKYIYGQAGVQNAEKYHALGIALLSAEKTLAILGFSTAANEENVFLSVGSWASKLTDEYLRRVREEHDYSAAVNTIIRFRRDAEILGATTGTLEDLFTKLEKALNFDLEIKVNIQLPQTGTDAGVSYQIEGIEKNIHLSMATATWVPAEVKFTMISGTMTGDQVAGTYISPTTYYPVLYFDYSRPCSDSLTLMIDNFGPATETWSITENGETSQAPITGQARAFTKVAFFSKINPMPPNPGFFKFTPIPVNNSSEVFNETYDSESDQFPGKITMKLTHNPQ
jgi:hypothetical protein